MEDARVGTGPIEGRDPGDVAVEDEDDVCGFDGRVDAVLKAEAGAVGVREGEVAAAGVEDAEALDGVGELDHGGYCGVVAACVSGNDEGFASVG